MPPPNADLATTWAYLEEGVDHIMTKLQTGVSYSKYMSLYTVSYNYCTSSKMHGSGDQAGGMGHRSTCSVLPHTPMFIDLTAAGANLMGSDLYNNLIRYFVNHLKALRTVSRPFATPMSGPLNRAPAPPSGIGRAAGRSSAAVLRPGMGSLHDWR